jgi:hypothetical protein
LGDLNREYANAGLPWGGQQGCTYPGCTNSPQPDINPNGDSYPNYCFGDVVAFGFWDDLFINEGTQQGIYYEIDGTAPSRQTTFEFYLTYNGSPTLYYHFLIIFYEDRPNVVTYQYLDVANSGVDATVGVQRFTCMFDQDPIRN